MLILRPHRVALPIVLIAAAPGAALAAPYQFVIDHKLSTVSSSASVSAPVNGTLLGNYDPVTTPDGTRTLPGFTGGTGNQPIPYTAALGGEGDFDSQPDGSFTLDINIGAGTIAASGLILDLLAGTRPAYPGTFTITYQTFHTVNPSSIFIGGIPLPLPLGNFTLTTLLATQTPGPASGSMRSLGGNQYSISIPLTVDLLFEGTAGATRPLSQTSTVPLTLTGTLAILTSGQATLTSNVVWEIDETQPLKLEPITAVPLDVPTILPTGSTAHLLLSGDSDSLTTQLTLDAMLISGGQLSLAADLNGDGNVNGIDLAGLLAQWGPCPKVGPCSADFNADGFVNGLDLGTLLASWG